MIASGTTAITTAKATGHAGLCTHVSPLHDLFVAKKSTAGTIKASGQSNVPSTFSVCDHVGDFQSRTSAISQPMNGTKNVPMVSHMSAMASTRFTA
jgi:hypothetical protein